MENQKRNSGLNPMELKTGSAYLEYILNAEGQLLWMHFDEAQFIESEGKDEAFEDGFQTGFKTALNMIKDQINTIEIKFNDNEQ